MRIIFIVRQLNSLAFMVSFGGSRFSKLLLASLTVSDARMLLCKHHSLLAGASQTLVHVNLTLPHAASVNDSLPSIRPQGSHNRRLLTELLNREGKLALLEIEKYLGVHIMGGLA